MDGEKLFGLDGSLDKLKQIFTGPKLSKVIVVAGILGIGLIILSQFTANDTGAPPPDTQSAEEATGEQYVAQLEQKLGEIIGSIDGVGHVKIMITLYQGTEYVYAKERTSSYDTYKDTADGENNKTQEKNNSTESYLLVENASGRRQALLTTQIEPLVKGVVVVCDGADSPIVAQKVTEAVTTALDVPAHRVCVTKLGESSF